MSLTAPALAQHPYLRQPSRTILRLSLPILLSLVAEPLTGLVDTGFVARLGTAPLAALAVGASVLSSMLWIFSFLGIAIQTDIAQISGRQDPQSASQALSLALALGLLLSVLLCALMLPGATWVTSALGATGEVQELSVQYIRWRLLGAPAVIIVFVGFGALRGLQEMRRPLWIALFINLLNIVLDALLIFGWEFIPALGVAGAGLASSLSQWLGALWILLELQRRLGLRRRIQLHDGWRLLTVGRDLVIRSACLTLFLLFATRVATQLGAEAGAAHQVIRQVWFFSALFVEAFATTAQSLVGYFCGAGRLDIARQVAVLTTAWSLFASLLLMFALLLGTPWVNAAFVPAEALSIFSLPWTISCLSQPLNALAFVSDGIHWGTGDYRYLRNGMLLATAIAMLGLQLLPLEHELAFGAVWLLTSLWIAIRALWGMLRISPGFGKSPLARRNTHNIFA